MKLSDKILQESCFIDYAKKIDPFNYQDLFNDAWLKFRDAEIKGIDFKIQKEKSYKSYFYSILKNTFINQCKRNKVVYTNDLKEQKSTFTDYEKINVFLEKKDNKTLRNFVNVMLNTKNKSEAMKEIGISGDTFAKILEKANKLIEREL